MIRIKSGNLGLHILESEEDKCHKTKAKAVQLSENSEKLRGQRTDTEWHREAQSYTEKNKSTV